MEIPIEDQVRKVIKDNIDQEIKVAVALATDEIKNKLREKLGVIAVRLAKRFDVKSGGHSITITYEEEDRK